MSPSHWRVVCGLLAISFAASVYAMPAFCENAERVTVCQLRNDPAAYDHHLVEVTAFVEHDFEDFSVFDPDCQARAAIWLEYGGTADSNTMYCCPGGPPSSTRSKPLVIENISVPLVNNENFRALEQAIQPPFRSGKYGSIAHAVIVGRFFAGRKDRFRGDQWSGYGHMGCCSLLAIQEVLSVDPQNRDDLDYGASPDRPAIGKKCGYRSIMSLGGSKRIIDDQQRADRGQRTWAFEDSERVASEELATFLKVPADSIKTLKTLRTGQGRVVYEWNPTGKKTRYVIVVSRPYWVSFYSRDANKVAWAVVAAYAVCE
jgi:hypothetical protein